MKNPLDELEGYHSYYADQIEVQNIPLNNATIMALLFQSTFKNDEILNYEIRCIFSHTISHY